jgi:pimeloyl-ACP methyl ester carboxylesterase
MLGRRMAHLLTWATDDIVGKGALFVAKQWEDQRRPYVLCNFPTEKTALQGDINWSHISSGRALLFIHGTFSTASSAFAELPKSTLDSLSHIYEGRLLAFNHPSLSVSPEQNAKAFIDRLPDSIDLKLDVITHSRGGLVGRELIERFAELHAAGRRLKVERAVMVAAPQRGTILTDEDHGIALIDRFTNLLTKLPDNAYTLTVEGILMLVKLLAHGALKGLPGLRSMYPGGEYLGRLNSVPSHITRYFAVGAQFVPSLPALRERFGKYLGEKFLDEVFGEESDGVVPTLGSYDNGVASAFFPISNDHRLIFDQDAGIHHCNYFENERLNKQMIEWLAI